jgi:hypothetical protein
VNLLRKTHLKQAQSRPLSNRSLDDNDNVVIDDEVAFGRNKRAGEFGKLVHEDDDDAPLSDYVMTRLAKARALAMQAYRNAHSVA